ncbi:MAG: DUF1349 domain-containing protein [Sedimentisphaerales bacterium]|nr:DUF1349 domain-containing protein [Sedimentisphaerales bacterium]
MKRLIAVLVFVLFFNVCVGALPFIDEPNTCDCNCVCPEPEPLPVAYLFDDFNDAFDLAWIILNEDESHWSFDTEPNSLTITTQQGTFENSNNSHKNVFLTHFPVSQALDFQVTTCISNFQPQELFNQAGLLLWFDQDNYLKFDYEYGYGPTASSKKIIFAAGLEASGITQHAWFYADPFPQTVWLRIIKRGDTCKLYNSIDGIDFNPVISLGGSSLTEDNTIPCLNVPVTHIGIFASNDTISYAPDVDASFEYFEFKTLAKELSIPEEPNNEPDPGDTTGPLF